MRPLFKRRCRLALPLTNDLTEVSIERVENPNNCFVSAYKYKLSILPDSGFEHATVTLSEVELKELSDNINELLNL